MTTNARVDRVLHFSKIMRSEDEPNAWKKVVGLWPILFDSETVALELLRGNEQIRPFVFQRDETLVQMLADMRYQITRESEMTPLERRERWAKRDHDRIQEELERDKSGGDPRVCYKCSGSGNVLDSRLEPVYDERLESEVTRCRSWVRPCECSQNASEMRDTREPGEDDPGDEELPLGPVSTGYPRAWKGSQKD